MKKSKLAICTLVVMLTTTGMAAAERAIVQQPAAPVAANAGDDAAIRPLRMEAIQKDMAVLTAQLDGDDAKIKTAQEQSIAVYDKILALLPKDVVALNARGFMKESMLKGSGKPDLDASIALTTALISENASNGRAHYDRAVAYRNLKMYDEARADYKAAIALNPEMTNWATDLRAMETEAR